MQALPVRLEAETSLLFLHFRRCGGWASNRYFQDLDIRFRRCAFFSHDLQRSGDGFAEVGEKILDGLAL
jgi:hypothetical protein